MAVSPNPEPSFIIGRGCSPTQSRRRRSACRSGGTWRRSRRRTVGVCPSTRACRTRTVPASTNEASWDVDRPRDRPRSYVLTGLAAPDAALVPDDTQAINKRVHSVGVAPQRCGLTGQTENCQCMAMLTYASRHGHAHAFVDQEL
ncbi:transposase [Micromonospora sp. LOL_023]|uniref:transposase n=1 Tax=Micromonospora sp. LOL_023 TaxID=3345418 RepID=UPI003A880844